jgi:hypothetical protein
MPRQGSNQLMEELNIIIPPTTEMEELNINYYSLAYRELTQRT